MTKDQESLKRTVGGRNGGRERERNVRSDYARERVGVPMSMMWESTIMREIQKRDLKALKK